MAFIGPDNYVVVVVTVGGSKALDIKLVLQREPRIGETWFHAGSISHYEEHVDAVVRELREETGLTLTSDDLTLLSNNPVRVSLHEGQHWLVYVFSAYVPVPFVPTNIRTPTKLVQVVTTQSAIKLYGTYVVLATIDIDGLSLTSTKNGRLDVIRYFELLHFGNVGQLETFRQALTTN
jgi:8-oxo-dGTP pyrophosphatase MutT (NUDIX family)